MWNLISGRIARLVLIQLQFLKKELLVSMQAIDELFNANQVNLQLLAVAPAVLAVIALQVLARLLSSAIKASTRGRGMESAAGVHRDLRNAMREMERALVLSRANQHRHILDAVPPLTTSTAAPATAEFNKGSGTSTRGDSLTTEEWGRILSLLHRLQLILVVHSSNFETSTLEQLQEDLRDLTTPRISIRQRLEIIDRINRHYAFLQPTRRIFGGSFMQ